MWADFSLAKLTRRQLWFCYGAYLVFLVVAAFMSVGWQQPDEHTRVLEPAHYIAYGYATLTWEFRPEFPLVSFFLGAIHSWPLIFTKFLGLSGLTEASVAFAHWELCSEMPWAIRYA